MEDEKKKKEQGLELGFGYYNLRSRDVKLASPDELNRLKKPRYRRDPRAPPRPTREQQKIISRAFRAQCIEMADVALSSYNDQQKADYVFVNPSSAAVQIFTTSRGFVAHANFQARPRDHPRAPVAVFFAELKNNYKFGKPNNTTGGDPPWVSYRCSMLGCKGSLSDVVDSCANFDCEDVYHPSDGNFTFGSSHSRLI